MLLNPGTAPRPATTTMPSRRQAIAALTLGSVALLILGLQPLLLGELVAHKSISLEGVGLIAMGEIIALGIGVIVGNTLLSPARLSSVAAVAAALLSLLNLLTMQLHGDVEFLLVRVLAGLAAGVLVWVTTSVIVRTATPARLAAVFLVSQTLSQAAVAAFLTTLIVPRNGWAGGFMVLAASSAALLILTPALRPGLANLTTSGSGLPPRSVATAVTFGVILAQMGAIGALWAYLDPLGRGVGLSGTEVGTLISTVLILQVLGGSIAAWVARRLRAPIVLMVASVLLGVLALGMHGRPPVLVFCTLCALFGFVWLFQMPFQVRLAFAADPTGRVAVLVPALQLLGVAFGPLLASLLFVTDDNARPVPLVCAGFALVALGLLVLGRGCFGTEESLQHPSGE
jgi:MFS transporter, DHA1 family, inner membrane transport protein